MTPKPEDIEKAELLPCPFCGSAAEMDTQRGYRMRTGSDTQVAVYCPRCNADMSLCRHDHPDTETEELVNMVTENWNRRDLAKITELNEAHKKEIADLKAFIGRDLPESAIMEINALKLVNETLKSELEVNRIELVAKWMQDELHDFEMVLEHCAEVYMYCSGGLISKPQTLPAEVIRLSEDRESKQINEAVEEATKTLDAQCAEMREALLLLKELYPNSQHIIQLVDVALKPSDACRVGREGK